MSFQILDKYVDSMAITESALVNLSSVVYAKESFVYSADTPTDKVACVQVHMEEGSVLHINMPFKKFCDLVKAEK